MSTDLSKSDENVHYHFSKEVTAPPTHFCQNIIYDVCNDNDIYICSPNNTKVESKINQSLSSSSVSIGCFVIGDSERQNHF